MQDDLKRTTNDLLLQQEKLKKDVDTMGIKIDGLKKELNNMNKCKQFPHEIPYDLDIELNNFLKASKIQCGIRQFEKAYRNQRLLSYIPFVAYIVILCLAMYYIYRFKFKLKILKSIKLLKSMPENTIKILFMIVVMAIGLIILGKIHNKLREKLNVKLATTVHDLYRTVYCRLNQGSFNSGYLVFLLEQRKQEKYRLNQQFSAMIKMFDSILRFTAILGFIFPGIIINLLSNDYKKFITADILIISVVVIVGLIIDYLNYHFFDADYYRRQILLEAVKKYQIENKH